MDTIDTCAATLDRAMLAGVAIEPFSAQEELDVADAYRVQQAGIAHRLARGERVVGLKMGFTSVAKMRQMGVADQIFGQLTDAMQVANGATISLDGYIHPRCEPEIAFQLKHDLPAAADEAAARAAIAAVTVAIEIIDSRYKQFRFSLTDVIADNASSSGFVLGRWVDCPDDLSQLAVELHIDDGLRQAGTGADILGDPLRSLVAAARLTSGFGGALPAGSIVLAGAATPAEALAPGQRIEARISGLGTAAFAVRAR